MTTATTDQQTVNVLAQQVADRALHDNTHLDQWITDVLVELVGEGYLEERVAYHTAVTHRLAAVKAVWPDEQARDERDAQLAEVTAELESANANAAEIADQRAEYREEIMRLRAQVRELKAAQDARDGNVRAVAEVLVRLKAWLTGRRANVHPKISTTSVIAEPRDRSTAAWAIAESDVRAAVAALEARDVKEEDGR